MPALFSTGRIVATPGVIEAIPQPVMIAALRRHLSGDFGECDAEDTQANRWSIQNGERIVSVYSYEGIRFYVITERDRSVTTFLLPSEY